MHYCIGLHDFIEIMMMTIITLHCQSVESTEYRLHLINTSTTDNNLSSNIISLDIWLSATAIVSHSTAKARLSANCNCEINKKI